MVHTSEFLFWSRAQVDTQFSTNSTLSVHSWSVPLDEKESETESDPIDLIFSLPTNFGTRNRLEMVLKWFDLVFSCILDDRFILTKKSPKLKLMRLTWFSTFKRILFLLLFQHFLHSQAFGARLNSKSESV